MASNYHRALLVQRARAEQQAGTGRLFVHVLGGCVDVTRSGAASRHQSLPNEPCGLHPPQDTLWQLDRYLQSINKGTGQGGTFQLVVRSPLAGLSPQALVSIFRSARTDCNHSEPRGGS